MSTKQEEIIKMAIGHLNEESPNGHLNTKLGHLNPEHDDHLNNPEPESDSSTDSSTTDDEPIKMANSAAQDMAILINESDDVDREVEL